MTGRYVTATRIKLAVMIGAFAVCVWAYVSPDKTYFDLFKLIWQVALIWLLFAEYGLSRIVPLFITLTVCTGIYLLPYKSYTDIPSLLIENGLLIGLYWRYRQVYILRILNQLILISAIYGLIKEVLGYACEDTLTDLVIGSFSVVTFLILFTIMFFTPHKESER